MKTGRIILGALLGFLFFSFIAVDLVLFGVFASNSAMVTVLAVLGAVVGGVLGALAGTRAHHERHGPPSVDRVETTDSTAPA